MNFTLKIFFPIKSAAFQSCDHFQAQQEMSLKVFQCFKKNTRIMKSEIMHKILDYFNTYCI